MKNTFFVTYILLFLDHVQGFSRFPESLDDGIFNKKNRELNLAGKCITPDSKGNSIHMIASEKSKFS